MDLLVKHFTTLVNLLIGGVLVIGAVHEFVKNRRIIELVVWLSFGLAFTALGLFHWMGLIAREWVGVSQNAMIGLGLIWTGTSALYSPPSPGYPNWTKWAWLVIGVGWTLSALYVGLIYYFGGK